MKTRIRDLREDADYTQQKVADYLMCDQSLYSKYEREERELPLAYAVSLADLYGVSLDYVVYRTDTKKPYPRKNYILIHAKKNRRPAVLFCYPVCLYSREKFTISPANTMDTMLSSLIRMLMAGPAVSLKGSPTVSPTTPAL